MVWFLTNRTWFLSLLTLGVLSGCRGNQCKQTICQDTREVDCIMSRVDSRCASSEKIRIEEMPRTLVDFEKAGSDQYWELSLQEAVNTALTNTEILRDLGATVLRAPQVMSTTNRLAIQQTDPRYGMEAALSAFDTQLDVVATFQKNDRRFNNRFFGGGSNIFVQDRHDYITQLSKRTAAGTQLALRNVTDYDASNATGNLVPSSWQTQIEGELRQSLLRGGGTTFNRIAGPNSQPGVYGGVLIAKVNSDINEIEFEESLRKFVSDIENAYWDLYFSYRDYDAKRLAVERSRETWQNYEAQKSSNRQAGTAEALAREQYFRFQADLQDAIAGKSSQRTQSGSAAEGGVFAGVGGIIAAERRLRLMLGLPLRDERIIRPSDEPMDAKVVFDWEGIAIEAVQRRPELRKQRLLVERRRLELLAAKNYLLPQLDLLGRYRFRGLDKHLIGDPSAYNDLGTGDFQEWEVGFELSVPIGFRQAHAAVQHAQQLLRREQIILHEQERQIMNDLGLTVAEAERAALQIETHLNRYLAASDAYESMEANRKAGLPINLEQLLDAQRRVVDAQSRYFLSRVEYAIALKNVQLEKGTLLGENQTEIVSADPQMLPSASAL